MACNADICTNDSQGNPFCKPASNCLSKCLDGILSLCQTDGSSSIENCANKYMICGLLDDGTPACVDQTQSCQSICKEGLLSICHEDGSVTTENCANNNMICGLLDDGTLTCVDKTQSCQSTCQNDTLSQCHEDGSITTKNCSLSGMICGLDEAGSPTCVDDPNRKQCTLDGKTLKPGQKACDADGNVVTCNEDGTTSSTPCERGVCTDGDCIPRNCGDVADGQKTCQNLKLVICNDGQFVEADPGCSELMLCRDGDSECSNYNACDTIAHNAHGCLDSNIVLCNDGTTSLVEDCVANNQSCAPNEEADCGFYCKSPDPTDCDWNGGVVEIDQTVCDGNLLKTCSAEVNTQFDEGRDCVDIDPAKPVCDVNVCREEKYCGNELEIAPGDIVCNEDETNKAECVDGTLVDLTDDDACSARENAHPVCTYTSEAVCSDVCDTGFTDVNGSCETIKICDAIKEIYQESTNTCTCNNDAHYVGEAGNCHCDTGYFEIQNQCKVGCLYADIEYQYGDSTCSSEGKVMTCQPDGSMLDATCEIGVCINGECVIRDCGDLKDGETRCQSGSLMMCSDGTLAAASTPCTANQLCLDGQNACVDKKVCTATGTMLNSQTNTCICNINKGWFGDGMTCDCQNGDVPIGDECVPKATCDETKETYVSATNSCACDTANHWAGTAGNCTCANGYVPLRGICEQKKSCDTVKETYQSATNSCSCNYDKHFVGSAGACKCENGYVLLGKTCELKATCDTNKETYLEATNTCECDYDKHFIGVAGACKCENGFVLVGNTCEPKATCKTNETYNSATNTCSCNSPYVVANGACEIKATCKTNETYTASTNSCACNAPYVVANGNCEVKATCKTNETYVATTNKCACDTSNHWTGTAGACTCDTGYVLLNGACVAKATCDANKEIYNAATNTCACNTAAHWTGTAGACTCDSGYVQIGGKCELIKSCDTTKEIYNAATNTCACDTAKHWTGTAGSCTCDSSSVLMDGACVAKATCDTNKEIYNSSTNTCACNTAAHWTGAAGACTCETNYFLENGECVSRKACNINEIYHADTNTCSCAPNTQWNSATNTCVCKTGFYQNGNTCSPDDAQHCRGIDCTAVSYWDEGICTDAGKCQVTSCAGDYHLYENGTTKTCEANSIEHCGNHDTQCDPAGSCENGTCVCADDKTFCGDVCIDLKTDIDNCGECGKACAYGLSCINGKCLGNTNCGGVSYNTATSLDHCGTCNHRCSDGTTCIDGECVAGSGPAYCGDKTVQLNTPEHCESCAPCADGLICQNNQCVAGQGKMICNNIVVDSTKDSANCGSCGNVCNAGFECVNSTCKRIADLSTATITCNAKTVKPYTDRDNCAGCNIACSNTTSCHAGVCDDAWVVGDIIPFGRYEQDNDTTNGKEPITWRVLDIKDRKLLLISEKVLDVKFYNTTNISITWAKSTIRSWLNGYDASYNTVGTSFTSSNFIDAAFTAEEKAKIVASKVPAHANPSYSTSPGVATTDKSFLLSITEANNYFKDNADRMADATRYAVKKGAGVKGSSSGNYTTNGTCTDVHCTSYWWLRSPGSYTRNAAHVYLDGSVAVDGIYVDYDNRAVRPALWVNL